MLSPRRLLSGLALLPAARLGRNAALACMIAIMPAHAADPVDRTFARDGLFDLPAGPFAWNLGATADGRIYAVGGDVERTRVVRLLRDGTPDPAFGANGVATIDGVVLAGAFGPIAVAEDGALHFWYGRRNADGVGVQGIMKLSPDGTPDRSFGQEGRADVQPADCGFPRKLLRLPDGAHLMMWAETWSLGGLSGGCVGVRRVTRDGMPDAGFGTGGAFSSSRMILHDAIVRSDGSLDLLMRDGDPGNYTTGILRLTPEGRPDEAFGARGVRPVSTAPGPMRFAPDGSLVKVVHRPEGWLERHGPDKWVHPAVALLPMPGAAPGFVSEIAALADGYVAYISPWTFVRLDHLGRPVAAFGNGGRFDVRSAFSTDFREWIVHPDGDLLVVLRRNPQAIVRLRMAADPAVAKLEASMANATERSPAPRSRVK